MPIRLSDWAKAERETTVTVGEDVVMVVYNPNRYTPALEDSLRELNAEQRTGAALVEVLSQVLVRWDVLSDKGKPLGVTPADMAHLPTRFLWLVLGAIGEDMRGGGQADLKASVAGSSRKAK